VAWRPSSIGVGFFVFCHSALRARGGRECGVSVLAPLRKTIGIDQRVRKTSPVTPCEVSQVGLPVRVRLSLRLSLFVVVGSARRLRLPTSASASSSSPSYQPSSASCRCACPLLLPPPSKPPSASEFVLPSSQSPSSTARSFPYPSIPLVVSSVQCSKRNVHSTHHTT
jgi:hypothetical protein